MSVGSKHEVVAAEIRRRIEQSIYTDLMPSESQLMTEFAVSRSTARQAFTTLENEGLVVARSGALRRVASHRRLHWSMTSWEPGHRADEDAWAASVREQGREPTWTVAVHVEQASAEVAEALGVEADSPVTVRRRIRFVDGEVHHLSESYFPEWLTREHPVFTRPYGLTAAGGVLASVGIIQRRFLDEMTARMPTPDEARQFRIGRGVPLLIHTRTGFEESGRAVRHMVTRMTADRIRVTYELET